MISLSYWIFQIRKCATTECPCVHSVIVSCVFYWIKSWTKRYTCIHMYSSVLSDQLKISTKGVLSLQPWCILKRRVFLSISLQSTKPVSLFWSCFHTRKCKNIALTLKSHFFLLCSWTYILYHIHFKYQQDRTRIKIQLTKLIKHYKIQ